jgi:hypothetical protein
MIPAARDHDCRRTQPAPRQSSAAHGSAADGQLTGVQLSDLVFALVGVGALLAGILPRVLERRPLSMPIAFLAIGMIVFALPLG